jgi:hypothetical protein
MGEPLQIRAHYGNRSWCHTWNPAGLAKRRGLDLAEALYHLARQPGDSLIREAARDTPGFILLRSYNVGLLPFQIPMVFDDRLGR